MTGRRALITGVSGQDGRYLAELLHARGWQVFGLSRREPDPQLAAIAQVTVGDVTDAATLRRLVQETRPEHCYHLAAYHRSSQAETAEDQAALASEEAGYLATNLLPVQTLLAALRALAPRCRTFLAGSCHMFGSPEHAPQTEATPFRPNSLYGLTKVAAMNLGHVYRQKHGLFCCTGILYNHESPRRGPSFVTTRIARAAAELASGGRELLTLGSLDARVDWGFAGDFVEAMVAMLESDTPRDLIIATGVLHTVGEFARLAFERVGLDWSRYVREDAAAHHPVAASVYCGDSTEIRSTLGWAPRTSFESLVALMVDHHAGAERQAPSEMHNAPRMKK